MRAPRQKLSAKPAPTAKPAPAKPAPTKSAPKADKVAQKASAPKGSAKMSSLPSSDIQQIYARFAKAAPAPETELAYIDPYTLLVAVVLSAQATDVSVNKATVDLFKRADTPAKMVALGEDAVRDAIKTIGLFNTKAKNVIALSKDLVDHHGGNIPQDRDALQKLPGVGRKSANVVMNVAFGQPTIAVDTHIFRVANRTGLAPGKNPLEVERGLEAVTPPQYAVNAHHWLILHGRYICKARKPECWHCLICDLCRYQPKTPAPASSGGALHHME